MGNYLGNKKITSYLCLIITVLYLATSKPILAYQQEISKTIYMDSGWNLISLPLHVTDGYIHTLFPEALTEAFIYQNGYVAQETLRHGTGYWLKFPSPDTINIIGTKCTTDCITLMKGWNLIGSIDTKIPYTTYFTDPCTLTVSSFYEYDQTMGYQVADSLMPGKGYWIKASNEGQLVYDSLGSHWNKISDIEIQSITVNHRNPNIIYGGLRSHYGNNIRGKAYKSYDGGFSWDTILTDLDYNGVVIDPTNDSILYLMIGTSYCGPPSILPGIWKSTDGGTGWFGADDGIYINCEIAAGICAIDYTNSEILYTSSGGFIPGNFYKTTNGGILWFTPIDFDTINCDIDPRCTLLMGPNIIMNKTNPDILYAAHVWGDEYLIKGTNGGKDWSYVGLLPEDADGSLANDIEQESTLYACGRGFYISTDEGKSWVMSNFGLPESSYISGIITTNSPHRLFIILHDGSRFDIYETTDRGQTWNSLGCPNAVTMGGCHFDDMNNIIYTIIDKKLYRKRFNKCFPS